MIGAVVVLYNPTISEIENINLYKDLVEYTVIVDNSNISNKKLVDEIISIDHRIIYYSDHKNLGLAKGFNIGVDILNKKGCEWALLFDADSKMETNIVSTYMKAIVEYKNKKVALFAPVHIYDRTNNKPYNGYKRKVWTMTSGCLYNCEIFKSQNGFFEKLFVDGLDMDYCLKSHENGYEVVECGEAVIKHIPAETKSVMGFKYGIASPQRYYMQARQLIWCWKRYKNSEAILIYLYKWFKIIFLFPNKIEYIRNMIKGRNAGYLLIKDE